MKTTKLVTSMIRVRLASKVATAGLEVLVDCPGLHMKHHRHQSGLYSVDDLEQQTQAAVGRGRPVRKVQDVWVQER